MSLVMSIIFPCLSSADLYIWSQEIRVALILCFGFSLLIIKAQAHDYKTIYQCFKIFLWTCKHNGMSAETSGGFCAP